MPPVGFEPVIPTSERPQTQFLDRAAAGRDTDEVFTFFYHPPLRGWRADCSPLSTVLYGCLKRVTIPEAVVIQLVLLMMSSVLLETC